MTPTLADRIDTLLPQTQCEQCGFHGCRPYAEAIAADEAGIDRCPPGGAIGIARLAALLDRPVVPLDPTHGVEKPRTLARIVEADCIGCTKCIQVCPVDAIVGANKLMHTILSDECNGCELCIPACPVDCIAMVLGTVAADRTRETRATHYRQRYETHIARLAHERAERERAIAAHKAEVRDSTRSAVLEAIARAKAKKGTPNL